MKIWSHRRLLAVAMAILVSTALAACGGGSKAPGAAGQASGGGHTNGAGATGANAGPAGAPVNGGTAYFAEQPGSPPNYIFPLISGQYYSPANVDDLQTLLYRPLYWYGDRNRPSVDYGLSLGNAPIYSDGNRVVTITLKPAHWSDGEPVSARDVGLWINLLKANRSHWASYVPGGFPDNVRSWRALGPSTVQLHLNAAYNPVWFTNNELSQITPLPIAWDRTSLSGPAPKPTDRALPDTSPAGARSVYRFLDQQARHLSTYADSPLWSIVDGAWRLTALTTQGEATFIPNASYDGPNRPHLARFVELPFTSETAEFSVLRAGPAKGGATTSGSQISVGWVPDTDIPQAGALRSQGYRTVAFYPFGFDYFEPNFNNPTVGPILRQLYFRQAFQHLVDQRGWIHAYYGGLGVPTYSPVPAQPRNPYSDSLAAQDPYPFSISATRSILTAHGWKVRPGGLTTCVDPGTGPGHCGAGIPAGKQLVFTLMYPSGLSYTDGAMTDLQSVAGRVGIKIVLKQATIAGVTAAIEPCRASSPACAWQLGQYGEAWVFAPDHYPTGEEIFQSGALGNVNNYSNPRADRLIVNSTRTPAAGSQAALNAYADYLRTQLPDFWQPSPGTLLTVQGNLGGMVPNAYGFVSPEEWYFTR